MRICLFGHFGTLNTGNEATLIAILARLRTRFPDGEFCCICTDPDVVAARDQIEAVPITGRVFEVWNRRARTDNVLKTALRGLKAELDDCVRAFSVLKGTDMLIIPGTGILTDAYGLTRWGPYNVFKWSVIARLRGCRVSFVSVGIGPLDRLLGRALVKSALSLATYRSYRDRASMEYLRGIGFRAEHDRIYPDLVFSLPERLIERPENEPGRRRVVGVGLMAYAGKYSAVNPSGATETAYLESLVALVRWLLAHDHDIRLVLGDGDVQVIDAFKSVLDARLGAYDEDRISYEPDLSLDGVLSQLAATDLVVATRFHNLLFALLLNKPVIAISFHHKCASLMSQIGISEYCEDIHRLAAEELLEQFQKLELNTGQVRDIIRQGVESSRNALDEQYDLLLEGL